MPCGRPKARRFPDRFAPSSSEFLLQEMAREANTIGAKSQDALLAQRVVDLKTWLERMREQVQNVE
jgi:uncharacterized protein (TIGR00255 family)